MIYAKQHLPMFIDGEPQDVLVDNFSDLLLVPWVAKWTQMSSFMGWAKMHDSVLLARTPHPYKSGHFINSMVAICQAGDLRHERLPIVTKEIE